MKSPETRRSINQSQEFNQSRRDFLKAAAGALALVGLGGFALWSVAESNQRQEPAFLTDDQKVAKDFFEEAQNAGKTLEVAVINPDNAGYSINVRRNPARLYDNFLTKVKLSERFEAIVVAPVRGLQQTDADLAGLWVAVEIDKATGKIGFIHSNYVRRVDGQVLTANQKIYDLRPKEADILSPLDQ